MKQRKILIRIFAVLLLFILFTRAVSEKAVYARDTGLRPGVGSRDQVFDENEAYMQNASFQISSTPTYSLDFDEATPGSSVLDSFKDAVVARGSYLEAYVFIFDMSEYDAANIYEPTFCFTFQRRFCGEIVEENYYFRLKDFVSGERLVYRNTEEGIFHLSSVVCEPLGDTSCRVTFNAPFLYNQLDHPKDAVLSSCYGYIVNKTANKVGYMARFDIGYRNGSIWNILHLPANGFLGESILTPLPVSMEFFLLDGDMEVISENYIEAETGVTILYGEYFSGQQYEMMDFKLLIDIVFVLWKRFCAFLDLVPSYINLFLPFLPLSLCSVIGFFVLFLVFRSLIKTVRG